MLKHGVFLYTHNISYMAHTYIYILKCIFDILYIVYLFIYISSYCMIYIFWVYKVINSNTYTIYLLYTINYKIKVEQIDWVYRKHF